VKVWLGGTWDEVFPGVYRQILAHNEEIMVMLVKFTPGGLVPRHSHSNIQAGLVIRGQLLFKTQRGERVLTEGDSYLLEPWETHEVMNIGGREALAIDVFRPARRDYAHAAREPDASL